MEKKLSILVIEDDAPIREVTTLQLEVRGYQVTAVGDGQEALDLLQRDGHAFDLVVTDLSMPNTDGTQLIRNLRASPTTKNLPILVLSGTAATDGMRAGADHFLAKPYTGKDLARAVEQALRMRATSDSIES